MSDQKKPEFEVEEIKDQDLEDVSGGAASLCTGGDACDGCEGCDGCATKPEVTAS